MTTFQRIVICTIVGSPTLLTMFISPDNHYWIIIIFKTWLPPTISTFYLFGLSKSVAYFFGLCNTKEARNDFEILVFLDEDEAMKAFKANKIR